MTKFIYSSILIAFAFLIFGHRDLNADRRDGKEQRRSHRLEDYNVSTLEELVDQALWYTQQGEYSEAKARFELALVLDHKKTMQESILVYMAGLEFQMGRANQALTQVRKFGRDHAESPLITNMVKLAFELGKAYTLGEEPQYKGWFRISKAFKAFEFVNTHDPYSIEAAESLLSMAVLNMKKRNWGEAIALLQDIHRKQPATDISARADVILGECYLGYNKGSDYDRRNLILAERYLKGYLDHYPDGKDRPYAQELLDRVYLRLGRGELDAARYYLTARKWASSKYVLNNIVKDDHLAIHHTEAKALLEYVENKL